MIPVLFVFLLTVLFSRIPEFAADPVSSQSAEDSNEDGQLRSNIFTCEAVEGEDEIFLLQPKTTDVLPYPVCCKQNYLADGWILIQRRFNGKLGFNRYWEEYRNGFGDLRGEFWLGLEKMHQLTNGDRRYELMVVLKDFNGTEKTARYERFVVHSEWHQYRLDLGQYSGGDAGDSMKECHWMSFSTRDKDNDAESNRHCAERYRSGWRFNDCYYANLNGLYFKNSVWKTMSWYDFSNSYKCLKESQMMIREAKEK